MFDFSVLPPEINSARIYTGPGPTPLMEAAQAWNTLSTELSTAAQEYGSVITSVATTWQGPSSTAMQTAAQPYLAWLTSTSMLAGQTAVQANAAAAAFATAWAASVPPPIITANRALLLQLIATNLLGQNTPAIAATEAQYMQMWAQDAAAMNTYAASSQSATGGLPPFAQAPQVATPAAAVGTGGWLDNSTTTGQLIQSVIQSGILQDIPLAFMALFQGVTAEETTRLADEGAAALNPVVIPPAGAPTPTAPAETPPVTAASGASNQIGRLSVPPSWARPPEQKPPQVTVDTPTRDRYQAAIPAIPFMPVTGLRSAQGRVREDPEFGHVSKVLPPRHPAGG